jgi:hypothetical protein
VLYDSECNSAFLQLSVFEASHFDLNSILQNITVIGKAPNMTTMKYSEGHILTANFRTGLGPSSGTINWLLCLMKSRFAVPDEEPTKSSPKIYP